MKGSYKTYLWSPNWIKRAKHYKWEKNYICEMCGNHLLLEVTELIRNRYHTSWNIPELPRFIDSVIEAEGDRDKLIQAHHRTYKNLGHEQSGDLACVCRICHVLISENTHDGDLIHAWDVTQKRAKEILSIINNNPDGEREFAHFIPYERLKTENQEEIEEAMGGYSEFKNDIFDIYDEFN